MRQCSMGAPCTARHAFFEVLVLHCGRQGTFINHAWIFREEGTGRRMSIVGCDGQVFWPSVGGMTVSIVAPPRLEWTVRPIMLISHESSGWNELQ